MAVTVTFDFPKAKELLDGRIRGLALISGTIAFDSSYPTGGEDITDITKKFKTCYQIICDNFGGYLFTFDKTNSLMKVLAPVDVIAGSTSAGANNYLVKSDTAGKVEVAGTGTAYQSAGAEVLDTTDLSGLTAVRFIALGVI